MSLIGIFKWCEDIRGNNCFNSVKVIESFISQPSEESFFDKRNYEIGNENNGVEIE